MNIKGPTLEDLQEDRNREDYEYSLARGGQPGKDVNSFRPDNIPDCIHKHDILDPKCKKVFNEFTEKLRERN